MKREEHLNLWDLPFIRDQIWLAEGKEVWRLLEKTPEGKATLIAAILIFLWIAVNAVRLLF